MELYTLSDGNQIPCMGFGCYNAYGDEIRRAVQEALRAGYRYIDSAWRYENEADIGIALQNSAVDRDELFVLSKAWPTTYEHIKEMFYGSLKDLRMEYLDAYLLHWPGTDETLRFRAYEQLLTLQGQGMIRTVGVSNFLEDQLEQLKTEFGSYPAINEIEIHPSFQQQELVDWCRCRDIQVIAYTPINRKRDLGSGTIIQIGEKYGKTPAQVILRWHVQKRHIPIPKSSNPERISENIDIFDFTLTEQELAAIDGLECGAQDGADPRTFTG